MACLSWSAEAEACLRDIHDFIARERPQAAVRVVLGILRVAEMLQDYPLAGSPYRLEEVGELRMLRCGRYRIPYPLLAADHVIVLGVFHESMNLDRFLPQA
ncbi:MAG: type II toxin-antitoxin system RelE/ParE family toxin [Candidatus Delongbacteria bacterium]